MVLPKNEKNRVKGRRQPKNAIQRNYKNSRANKMGDIRSQFARMKFS